LCRDKKILFEQVFFSVTHILTFGMIFNKFFASFVIGDVFKRMSVSFACRIATMVMRTFKRNEYYGTGLSDIIELLVDGTVKPNVFFNFQPRRIWSRPCTSDSRGISRIAL